MNIIHGRISDAKTIEEILCLATLITSGELSSEGALEDSEDYFIETLKSDCGSCKFCNICLATIINQ